MTNSVDLSGKHILITGGSSGIGQQCAIQASSLGARVTVIARREAELRKTVCMMERHQEQAYYSLDLSCTDKIESVVKQIAIERGPVDGFCHAAGVMNGRSVRLSKPKYVNDMFAVNTFSFFEFVRCLSQKENLNDGASLIGISSAAVEHGAVGQGIYAATKAGMNGFVVSAARELAHRKIRINTIAFANVDTETHRRFLECARDESDVSWQMLGTIDVISAANAITFLLSDACKYITAAVIPIYAGLF